MPEIVRLPEVLTGMTEAAVVSWQAAPGDEIKAGQPLAEIETEKAVVEYAPEQSGTLAGFLVEVGQPITVGTPIAVLANVGESIEDAMSAAGTPVPGTVSASAEGSAGGHPAAVTTEAVAVSAEGATANNGAAPAALPRGGRPFASPLVRRLARERGLDLSRVQGSGPGNRIVRRDLDQLGLDQLGLDQLGHDPARPPAAAPVGGRGPGAGSTTGNGHAPADGPDGENGFTDIPHTRMRRAIARRLSESKSTVPHFYLTVGCRVHGLLEYRRAINEQARVKVTLNDFVVKAVAAAFGDVPEANAIWTPDAIRRFRSVSVGVAVAVDGGLVTPVVHNVDQRSLTDISRTIADLADRARQGRLRQPELEGGSFAVSNLGMYGIEQFAAIINPPHAGILAVGAATKQPVVGRDGTLDVATVMTVTLSGDHRVLDGALAAQWLGAFKKYLEHPLTILI